MLSSVYAKTLRDLRRGLVGWSIALVAVVGLIAALWPSVRDMTALDALLEQYPEALREIFRIESITSGVGFMNAELFTLMLPVMFIVFAIGRGARSVAGEEGDGLLEVLLATPISRTRLLLDKAAALATAVGFLAVVLFAATIGSSMAVGMGIGILDAAVASLAMALLGIEHGWLALAVGAATGRRALATTLAAAFAFAGYLVYALGALVDVIEPIRPLSPFHQALDSGPLGGPAGMPFTYVWLALAAVVVVGAAIPAFDRRDVAVG